MHVSMKCSQEVGTSYNWFRFLYLADYVTSMTHYSPMDNIDHSFGLSLSHVSFVIRQSELQHMMQLGPQLLVAKLHITIDIARVNRPETLQLTQDFASCLVQCSHLVLGGSTSLHPYRLMCSAPVVRHVTLDMTRMLNHLIGDLPTEVASNVLESMTIRNSWLCDALFLRLTCVLGKKIDRLHVLEFDECEVRITDDWSALAGVQQLRDMYFIDNSRPEQFVDTFRDQITRKVHAYCPLVRVHFCAAPSIDTPPLSPFTALHMNRSLPFPGSHAHNPRLF